VGAATPMPKFLLVASQCDPAGMDTAPRPLPTRLCSAVSVDVETHFAPRSASVPGDLLASAVGYAWRW
jgi:hypothetical protein